MVHGDCHYLDGSTKLDSIQSKSYVSEPSKITVSFIRQSSESRILSFYLYSFSTVLFPPICFPQACKCLYDHILLQRWTVQ